MDKPLNSSQMMKFIHLKNTNQLQKQKRIIYFRSPLFRKWRLQKIANDAKHRPIAVIANKFRDKHKMLFLCFKGNVIQADSVGTGYKHTGIPMFNTFCKNKKGNTRSLQSDSYSCGIFALQMAEDLLKYYDSTPNAFPEVKKDNKFVEVPK